MKLVDRILLEKRLAEENPMEHWGKLHQEQGWGSLTLAELQSELRFSPEMEALAEQIVQNKAKALEEDVEVWAKRLAEDFCKESDE